MQGAWVPFLFEELTQQGVHPASSLSQQLSLSHLYFNNNWWHKSSEPSNHIKSSFQIEDAFHGIAILSLSIVMEYLSMYSG